MVRLDGETLLDRALRVASEAGCAPVVVVLGAHARRIEAACDLKIAWVVVHAGWAEGMGSSVRAGMELVQQFSEVRGVVVLTCDMPGVTAGHLRALAEEPEEVRASEYAGRRGVPAYFPRLRFAQLLQLGGDAGARELLRSARVVELAGGEMDVDTVADLERLRGWK